MKRIIAFAVLYSVVMCAHAWVPEDFYLNNTPLQLPDEAEIKLLPSALRVVVVEGESEEIYADVLPEDLRGAEFSWSLAENSGVVRIYPQGRTCGILGVSEGEEKLVVSCCGEQVSIPVSVRKSPEIRVRSFERERVLGPESDGKLELYRTVVRILITLGALLCSGAVFYIISCKAGKRK